MEVNGLLTLLLYVWISLPFALPEVTIALSAVYFTLRANF